MTRKKYYLTLDTETSTLPFVDECIFRDEIAIAKPLVYDIGWVITDRGGNIIKKANYLVQETFFTPKIMNVAFYKSKQKQYINRLHEGVITTKCWRDITAELIEDIQKCELVAAYNACFDFKKAIPFTNSYIYHLYRGDYDEWEKKQLEICLHFGDSPRPKYSDYLNPYCELCGVQFPLLDLWALSCEHLINSTRYKDFCIENGFFSPSGKYFTTNAEVAFRYLMKDIDFIEEHTALSDAIIESQILTKALKKGKVEPDIKAFPFRELGTIYNYIDSKKTKKSKEKAVLALEKQLEKMNHCSKGYWNLSKTLETLKAV